MSNTLVEGTQAKLCPLALPALSAKPLVSVLMANYNYERYIGPAIESVLQQSYHTFELVICDDGSTDHSCEVIEEYARKDTRIILLRQQNAGLSAALNTAYRGSRGEIICWLDSDDLFRPEKLRKVVEKFQSCPEAGFAAHPIMRIDAEGRERGRYPLSGSLPQGWLGPRVIESGGFLRGFSPTSAVCIRREVASRVFPLDPSIRSGQDLLTAMLALLFTFAAVVEEDLTLYRCHGRNLFNPSVKENGVEDYLARRQKADDIMHRVYAAAAAYIRKELPGVYLAPYETNWFYVENQYVLSKLRAEARTVQDTWYDRLMSHPQTGGGLAKYFFWLSPYLPRGLFKRGLENVYGQSKLKFALSRMWRYRQTPATPARNPVAQNRVRA